MISDLLAVLGMMAHTLFRCGHISSAVQPSVFQLSKSDRCARVYIMKLMELPPPSVPPHGIITSRSASCGALFPL
jgi:hypothetical protein